MAGLIYLDTGEIFETDEDGEPIRDPIATLQHAILDHDAHALGTVMAAAPELRDALLGMLGLVQLIRSRDDLSPDIRESLMNNHRIAAAQDALAKAEGI